MKAFDTTFAGTLVATEVSGQQLDVLIAGDDGTAKEKVAQRVSEGGLRPVDVGPLARAQQLEQLGFRHISLQEPARARLREHVQAPSVGVVTCQARKLAPAAIIHEGN